MGRMLTFRMENLTYHDGLGLAGVAARSLFGAKAHMQARRRDVRSSADPVNQTDNDGEAATEHR